MIKIFITTLNQMLVLFSFMLIGFILNKKNVLDKNAGSVLSKLETYAIVPALIFSVFSTKCTISVLREKSVFFIYGLVIVTLSFILALFLSKLFAQEKNIRNIYTYSFTISNVGYMGYAVVSSVFGEDALFNMMIFCLPYNIFMYSIGYVLLNPKVDKFSFRTLINPVFIAMIIGAFVGIASIPVPHFINNAVSSLANCMAPVAMILTGFIIANYKLKELLLHIKIYIASFIRLILMPLAFILILKFLGTRGDVLTIALSALAMPLGLNTIIFPASFDEDTTTGASMVLISHVLSVITIPIMFALLLN